MKKSKIEFSKLITLIAISIFTIVAVWSIIEYYIIVKLAIENGVEILPDATLPVTCITTILGAVLSYCLYQGYLKGSLNRNGLSKDINSGEIKSIIKGDTDNLIDIIIDDNNDNSDELENEEALNF